MDRTPLFASDRDAAPKNRPIPVDEFEEAEYAKVICTSTFELPITDNDGNPIEAD